MSTWRGRTYVACAHRDLSITFHNTDLNVFCAGLHNLQKTLYCEFDALIARHVIFVILLQELPNSFGGSSDRIGLSTT